MAALLNQTKLTDEQQEYVDAILVSSGQSKKGFCVLRTRIVGLLRTVFRCMPAHLLTVINDILDFSKIDSGKMGLNVCEMDVAHCMEQAVDLAFQPEYAGIRVSW